MIEDNMALKEQYLQYNIYKKTQTFLKNEIKKKKKKKNHETKLNIFNHDNPFKPSNPPKTVFINFFFKQKKKKNLFFFFITKKGTLRVYWKIL